MRVYCISCGEDVESVLVSIGIAGQELLKCPHCNSFLGSARTPQTLAQPAPPPPPEIREIGSLDVSDFSPDDSNPGQDMADLSADFADPPVAPGGEENFTAASEPPIDTIVVAEDTAMLREMLKDALVSRGLSRSVISCKNGYEFLSSYIQSRGRERGVGLVILDVVMPVLNGVSAAVAMRAHEKGRGLPPAPILFFTSKRCDETFKKILTFCQPAMYVNKGASSSPDHLHQRVDKVITQLLKETW